MLDTIQLCDASPPHAKFFEGGASITAQTAKLGSGKEIPGFAVVVKGLTPGEAKALETRLRELKRAAEPFLFFKVPAAHFDGKARVTSVGSRWLGDADFCLDFRLEAHSDMP